MRRFLRIFPWTWKDASSADQEKVQASTMPSSAKLRQRIPAINASKNWMNLCFWYKRNDFFSRFSNRSILKVTTKLYDITYRSARMPDSKSEPSSTEDIRSFIHSWQNTSSLSSECMIDCTIHRFVAGRFNLKFNMRFFFRVPACAKLYWQKKFCILVQISF